MIKRYLLAGLLTAAPLLALEGPLNASLLQKTEKSRIKDFYITEFMRTDASELEKLRAFLQLQRPLFKHFKAITSKSSDPNIQKLYGCFNRAKSGEVTDKACADIVYSYSKIARLGTTHQTLLASVLSELSPEKAKRIELFKKPLLDNETLSGKDLWLLMLSFDAEVFLTRIQGWWSKEHLHTMASSYYFKRIVERIVTRPQYHSLYETLLTLDPKLLDFASAFYIGISGIKTGDLAGAWVFIKHASVIAKTQRQKDRANFWLYQLSDSSELLNKLAKSPVINLYSLYALEKSGMDYPMIRRYAEVSKENAPHSDMDEFLWDKLYFGAKKRDDFHRLMERFNYADQEVYYAVMDLRANGARRNYFLTPYEGILEGIDAKRRALIYAIERQESLHSPYMISYAYAVGLMQIMPFLIRDIAKRRGDKIDVWKLFEPRWNLTYANYHLDWLDKRIKHPLFTAYAYNAGIGFTTRLLKKKYLFKEGCFEPYLSMELIPNEQAREYGKRVLGNYFVYRTMLERPIAFETLLEIKNPYIEK